MHRAPRSPWWGRALALVTAAVLLLLFILLLKTVGEVNP